MINKIIFYEYKISPNCCPLFIRMFFIIEDYSYEIWDELEQGSSANEDGDYK